MAARQLSRAETLLAEAEEKLSQARSCEDEVCALYLKAAGAFESAKEWSRAGEAFGRAAALQLENGRRGEAAMNFVEAAKCHKKVSPAEYESCVQKAKELYEGGGAEVSTSRQHFLLAELHEMMGNLELAVQEYQRAADMFQDERQNSYVTKCLGCIAYHSAALGDFEKGGTIYESLANESLCNKLLKYTASDLFTRAGLCWMAAHPRDGAGLFRKMHQWRDVHPAFSDTREYTWLAKMAKALDREDAEAFEEATQYYQAVTALTDWHNHLLESVKKNFGPDCRDVSL